MPSVNIEAVTAELLEVQRTLGWMDLVIGSIDDAVYVTDNDKRIVFANQYFANIIGQPRIFLLGKTVGDVFKLQTPAKLIPEYTKSVKEKRIDGNGEPVGIFEWTNSRQEQYIFRVSTRKLKTTGQTVNLAQDITAEYAVTRMKNSFVDLASHQLKTPLTAVMTYAHMLHDGMRGDLSPGQQELSGTIIRASERMVKLVDDLLTITRVQNTQLLGMLAPVSLSDLFEKIDMEVAERARIKKLNIHFHTEAKADSLLSCESTLREVISNLVVNAIQYTPVGGRIDVKATQVDSSVVITVRDNGIGIAPEYLPDMFEQFSRGANAMAVYPEGTGLGLYVIKILLEKVGGTISCSSQLNKGTCFKLNIPS